MRRSLLALALLVVTADASAEVLTYTQTRTAPGPASPGGSLQTQLAFPAFDLALGTLDSITFSSTPAFTGTAGAFLASDEHFLVTVQMNTILRLFGPGVSLLIAPASGGSGVLTDRGFFHIVALISPGAGSLAFFTTGPSFSLDPFTTGVSSQVLLNLAADPPNYSFPSIGSAPFPPTGYGSLVTFGGTYAIGYHYVASGTALPQILREAGGIRLRWDASGAGDYRVEFNDTLTGPWQAFPDLVTVGAGGPLAYFDATQPVPTRRFYRVVALTSAREVKAVR